jgi:uncharacterized protein YjaZ
MNLIPKIHPDTSIPDALIERIKKVITRAEKEVAITVLKLRDDVTILIDTDPNMIDPNIGVGGYTDDKSQIQLSINPAYKELHDDEVFATLVHELSHVKRAYGPWYGTTLFDYLIFEGLGVAFEEEICGPNTYYPAHLRKLDNAKQLVEKFAYMFDYDDTQYDYMDFVLGNTDKNIPEFAVYSMGLFIVDQYLMQAQKKVSDLLLDQPEVFRLSIK